VTGEGASQAGLPLSRHGSCRRGRCVAHFCVACPGTHIAQRDVVRIVIIGASAAGIFSALVLGRSGHDILLIEQDDFAIAEDAEAAARIAFRTGAPQIVQPHAILPRCRELLLEHLPDVYSHLLAAGAVEAPLRSQMPSTLTDREAQPGDERLTMLMIRRSTLDWTLRRVMASEDRIQHLCGRRATGLITNGQQVPHINGIRTGQGDLSADLVIDASGYRTRIDQWLAGVGASQSKVQRGECGIAYFSRHYRVRHDALAPGPPTTRTLLALDEFTVGIWGCDRGTMQIAIGPLASDHRFKTVRDPEIFTAVLRTIPAFSAWLDVLNPISDVFAMGSVQNTLRRLVVAGLPVATGLHAVGDSVCTTNPTLGRGLLFALSGAIHLRDLIATFGHQWTEQAIEYDARIGDDTAPFYEDQVLVDSARLAILQHRIFDAPAPKPPAVDPDRVSFSELRTAAMFDPGLFRAFWGLYGMLEKPGRVYTDPTVVAGTRQILRQLDAIPAIVQPSREQLVAALTS
jgi:2-polyprenyl-6-methoxyphenol hydroxylase-like FAD-dependent oxidoreductase